MNEAGSDIKKSGAQDTWKRTSAFSTCPEIIARATWYPEDEVKSTQRNKPEGHSWREGKKVAYAQDEDGDPDCHCTRLG